jgi:glycosyltransferase involved in cell wall biosynthesis
LTTLKRLDLLLAALAEPSAREIRAVIAGDGESRDALETLAVSLGVADRVTFLGRIDDQAKLDHLAKCRAVCFTPFAEDYGFVTVEAFASRKAVVTCHDSGGPTELVRHDETGLVCGPTAAGLAAALARVNREPGLAERLGGRAEAVAASMTWPSVVRRLMLV